ncbi:type II toxin-antitoxin system death-on-curing family toxin [Methylotenera sp.]|uniref:type II toxin-antitoxin system death-on-curing family toxin n=1 Tax=Methylotenera sp. TaxID=2051956 RepID=UPI002723631E|nr:type II toxin-antitoxin system death-on-curing family toxin [Methylotenera sp.]MDO9204283.1 type II toxin-antitoxin system death-on-curing family toxin [Methylotenera sp.]MDP1523138.1 type II toxin-antitoxin system death-on-curing family toxin [Methylotenera sp.]MDP2070123.1 type II toxin-antitoxin system death-on-curing family toxin [Methylotenera sp.]MDP2229954.1 type II toxin-antitoxin system death-on-curing family toxin [Methylotenera sp.]MDP3005710.1 type II toxin-antitoxin system deat
MPQFRWIDKRLLIILHDESLALHGGASGIRDEGLLDSALNRAVNLAMYSNPDLAELAAAYGVGLAKNHAFVDGNKRAAFLSVGLFLGLNGFKLKTTQVEATLTMLAVAAGEVNEVNFAAWIRKNLVQR